MLVALEGVDGAGKTTLLRRLTTALEEDGRAVRALAFSVDEPALAARAAALLSLGTVDGYYAAHAIFSAWRLARKTTLSDERTIVIVDRYTFSTVAYGVEQGLDEAWCWELGRPLPEPDLVLLLDVAVEAAAERRVARDRVESDLALQRRVRGRYLALAASRPSWRVLDAGQEPVEVAGAAIEELRPLLRAR